MIHMAMVKDVQFGKTMRKSYAKYKEILEMPNMLKIQKDSYEWFLEEGLREVFKDVGVITDFSGKLELSFLDYSMEEPPKYTIEECKERDATYARPIKVRVRLRNTETGEIKEQEIFMGDFPIMTNGGTFVINGGAMMPSKLNPNIPGGLEQIIMKGMALELQDRYPSATEMLQDMEEFRKNPAIQFSYRSIIDDATRALTGIPGIARTTAEKVVQAKTGVKPQPRATTDSVRMRPAATAASAAKRTSGKVGTNTGTMTRAEAARRARLRQQMEEKQREEERRARVTTTAIVVCSAVAIIAIIAFLVALFNGALLNQENDYVEVPSLVGQMYGDDLMMQYDDFVILLQPQEYDDNHAKGIIIRQEPAAFNKVKKGSDLRITVSLGPEPEVKMMDDYTGYAQEGVKAALEGQGFKPIFKSEASDLYKEGEIIRTEPVAGTELQEGQTIKIWVSTGPDVVLQKMPDVVGMEQSVAESLLDQLGFKAIRTRPVESDKPKGVVVYQSQKHNEEIDVTTEILLEISEGPEETEPTTQPTEAPTTPPTEAPTQPPLVSTNVVFQLPVRDVMYVMTVYQGGVEVVGATQIQPGTSSYSVTLTGIGTQNYDVYVDGFPYNTQTVEFSNG